MKLKQFIKHFWHGASTINFIELYKCSRLVSTLYLADIQKCDAKGFEDVSINSFLIKDNMIKIYLKPDR